MTEVRTRLRDERGFVGRLMVVWLVLLAVVVVTGIDAVSIALTTIKTSSAADKAAVRAAAEFKVEDSLREAFDAATEQLSEDMPDAKLDPENFEIDPSTGRITLTVTAKATTLIAKRVSFLKHLTKVSETSSGAPA
jgi:Flp pilus assembly protein TadG